jgi:hypothetical protein
MALGPGGLNRGRLSPGVDSVFELLAALDVRSVTAQPVLGPRQLPGGVEIVCVGGDGGAPDIDRTPGAGQVGAIGVETVCLSEARLACRGVRRLGRKSRDIE